MRPQNDKEGFILTKIDGKIDSITQSKSYSFIFNYILDIKELMGLSADLIT